MPVYIWLSSDSIDVPVLDTLTSSTLCQVYLLLYTTHSICTLKTQFYQLHQSFPNHYKDPLHLLPTSSTSRRRLKILLRAKMSFVFLKHLFYPSTSPLWPSRREVPATVDSPPAQGRSTSHAIRVVTKRSHRYSRANSQTQKPHMHRNR